jgi:hypothetical protein
MEPVPPQATSAVASMVLIICLVRMAAPARSGGLGALTSSTQMQLAPVLLWLAG